jgi:beta-glucanase (GH16 family)
MFQPSSTALEAVQSIRRLRQEKKHLFLLGIQILACLLLMLGGASSLLFYQGAHAASTFLSQNQLAPAAVCSGINSALNRPATASSLENSTYAASKAIDGNNGTRWSSAFSDPQWLQIDLGSTQTICQVVLQWEAAYGRAYQIQVSGNATTWTSIYSTTTGAGGTQTLSVSGSGRYIRMYGTQRGTPYGYSLWEVQVHTSSSQQLIFDEEFNGPAGSLPDSSKWSADVGGGGWGNNQLEYDTNNKNVSQDGNGNLVIEARKENPSNYQCWYGTCTYTSTRMNTKGKFAFTYGHVEARIKIPFGQGMWPAFWMLGSNIDSVGWPSCGEIDIFENIGKEPATIHGTVHGPGYSGANGIGGPYTLSSGRFADNYHIYAIDWNSTRIAFFVDGINYFTVQRSVVETKGAWVYDHPFFLILNVAVGGGWPGNPDSTTTFPQRMSVDYVRVYQ